MTEVIVMYNDGKLRMVYAHEADALCDKDRLIAKGTRTCVCNGCRCSIRGVSKRLYLLTRSTR